MKPDNFIHSESKKYSECLKKCIEIPSDVSFSYVYGYCCIFNGNLYYDNSLYWAELLDKGHSSFLPPVGDWKIANWNEIFKKIKPGTRFEFVPESLVNIWTTLFPGGFEISTDEGTWDYIYDVLKLKELPETRRLNRKFNRENKAEICKINPENVDEVSKFNNEAEYIIRLKNINLNILNNEDKAMHHILKHWKDFENLDGLIIKIDGLIVSYIIWEKLTENSAVALFNKNNYEYKGIFETCVTEMCNYLLTEGITEINYTCDCGAPGLKKAKSERKPLRMLKKYTVIYKGKTNE